MSEIRICHDIETGSFAKVSNGKTFAVGNVVVRWRISQAGKKLVVLGETVGQPFVLIRYRGEDGKVVKAEICMEDQADGSIEQAIELCAQIKLNSVRLGYFPGLRGMVKRIETLETAVRFHSIPPEKRPFVAADVSQKLGLNVKQVVFDD